MKHPILGAALMTAMALTATTPFSALAAREIPTIDSNRTVEDGAEVNFVTGGIGDDERLAIEASKSQYNVYITNASVGGAFVEDTQVRVLKKTGKTTMEELLHVNAGPLLYVQLTPGSYVIEATHGEETRKKNLTIGTKTKAAPVHFGWKVQATIAGDE